jgi:hypothetical protein
MGGLALAGSVPPLRVKLMRLEGHAWSNAERIEELSAGFEAAGFERIGDFDVEPAMFELRAFRHPGARAFAALYEHPLAGIWYDLFSYTPGCRSSFSFSTSQKSGLMDRRAEHPLVVITDLTTPQKACERFLQERPAENWAAVEAGEFVPMFERTYGEGMDWLMQQGGPSELAIRRITAADGQPATEQTVAMIRRAWSSQAAQHYGELLRERYLEEHPLSAPEWEEVRDRLIFIHAHTTAEDMSVHVDAAADPVDDDETDWQAGIKSLRRRIRETSPQEAFAALLRERNLTGRFRKQTTLSSPLPADVYIGPE